MYPIQGHGAARAYSSSHSAKGRYTLDRITTSKPPVNPTPLTAYLRTVKGKPGKPENPETTYTDTGRICNLPTDSKPGPTERGNMETT